MPDIFMRSIAFECPNCGQLGMATKLEEIDDYRLVEGLKKEIRDGEEVLVCSKCGSVSELEKSN